jgi:hypothetical protein
VVRVEEETNPEESSDYGNGKRSKRNRAPTFAPDEEEAPSVSDEDSDVEVEQMLKEAEVVSKDEEAPAPRRSMRLWERAKTKIGNKYKKKKGKRATGKFPVKEDEDGSEVVNVQLPFTFNILTTLLLTTESLLGIITIYRLLCNFSKRTTKTYAKFVMQEVISSYVTLVPESITMCA